MNWLQELNALVFYDCWDQTGSGMIEVK